MSFFLEKSWLLPKSSVHAGLFCVPHCFFLLPKQTTWVSITRSVGSAPWNSSHKLNFPWILSLCPFIVSELNSSLRVRNGWHSRECWIDKHRVSYQPPATLTVRVKGGREGQRRTRAGQEEDEELQNLGRDKSRCSDSYFVGCCISQSSPEKLANVIMGAGKFKICRLEQQTGDLRWADVAAPVWRPSAGRVPSYSAESRGLVQSFLLRSSDWMRLTHTGE